ncbi:XerD1: tyrosine recombinase [Desulfosarcina variabilis str. Montpellier]|uniref:site-specific integrase n=1 Tax=Desulfosarcina variabilis TaxID=2300 RepID=UPI003AFA271F
MKTNAEFPELLQAFFTDRLMNQRKASQHTIVSYRDTFRLFLGFAAHQLKNIPSKISFDDLDTPFIGAFLDYIEKDRNNSPRSRNVRLATIHSFFNYVAINEPCHSALAQRILAIPSKRFKQKQVVFLSRCEVNASLEAPDLNTWTGRRDQALLLIMVQAGLRVSELTALQCQDIILGPGAYVRCIGKGRKERCIPLRKETVATLRAWLLERNADPSQPLFPNIRGGFLSSDGVQYLLNKHRATASQQCQSLKSKKVSPHALRHTAAMDLLHHGVGSTVIALWLGHESVETTQIYIHADLEIKEKALAKTTPLNVKSGRYRPDDHLLEFLQNL